MRVHTSLRLVSAALAIVMGLTTFGWSVPAAGLIGTDEVLRGAQGAERRAQVQAFLQRQDVRDRLAALGVSGDEAAERVATLSDREVERIAGRIDSMPAGQVGVVELIVIVGIVLLVTDLLGYTNVYPFIKK